MNKKEKMISYIIRKYILILFVSSSFSSIIMTFFIALDSIDSSGNNIPLSFGSRIFLFLNFLSVLFGLVFIIFYLKKITSKIEDIEEKIIFMEENKAHIRKKIYIVCLIVLFPSLFVAGNTLFDSREIKNIACDIKSKDFTENKKTGKSYYLNIKCGNQNQLKIRVTNEIWQKKNEGEKIIIGANSGAFGLQRIRKISDD